MNTSLGFFGWLREGVRRSIVLGFSDAINEIGDRKHDEDLSPHLAAHLQESLIVDPSERTAALAGATATGSALVPASAWAIARTTATERQGGLTAGADIKTHATSHADSFRVGFRFVGASAPHNERS